ncbi:MAG: alkaline phosphatase family protein [Pseudomonadota bacterium]|nr:alkaline phosphatase family protein [Pseudomonadota bacterium]
MGADVLFIGVDGQDNAVIDAQIKDGSTPAMAALDRRLSRLTVENDPGLGDGSFWPSAATGGGPSEHGRYFHLHFDPQTYENRSFDEAADFYREAFWDSLDAEGRKVSVVDWPRGPFRRVKNGVVLDNWLQHDPSSRTRSYPENLSRAVIEQYGADPFGVGMFAHVPKTKEEFRSTLEACVSRVEIKTKYCLDQLKREHWDVFALAFTEPHDIAHYFYHLCDPDHPKYEREIAEFVGHPLRAIGLAVDRAVARLVEATQDSKIMMLSGPGVTTLVTANAVMEQIARRLDLGVEAERSPVESARTAYRSAVPLSLRRALSPIKRFMLREPQHPEFRNRRFFAVLHSDQSGCIRINLKGRERNGTVSPGEEYDRVLHGLIADLEEIRDADSGEPIVESVVRSREVYKGPAADVLPDLFVNWRRARPFYRITSPKIGVIDIPGRDRTGDHTSLGSFWADRDLLAAFDPRDAVRPRVVRDVVMEAARCPRVRGNTQEARQTAL